MPERDYVNAKAAKEQAEASFNTAKKHLADTRLVAPFSGIVTGKMIERGASASPGVAAFMLMKTDRVYATATVTESEIGKLYRGLNTRVAVPTIHQDLYGKISIINPLADQLSRTFKVKTLIDNRNGRLLPGMIANIRYNTKNKVQSIVIPTQCVVRDADDLTYVFVVNQQKNAIRKRVALGSLTSVNDVIVNTGLQAGDRVVTTGQLKLKDGQPVIL